MLRCFSRLPAIAWLPRLVAALSIILLSASTRGTGRSRGTRTKQKSFLFVAAATAAVAKEDNSQVSFLRKLLDLY